jgi:hypothetical protein
MIHLDFRLPSSLSSHPDGVHRSIVDRVNTGISTNKQQVCQMNAI